jgi:DNA-binding IclR family transcriptional regulator
MQNDVYAQYVHTVQSRAALRYFLKPGSLRPICRSATGYALLSAQPDSKVKRLVHKINSRSERGEVPVDEKSLLEKINDVRRLGYAYNDQLTEGISAIAMLLPTPPHGRQMALGLGGPTTRIQPKTEAIVNLMRRLIAQHLTSSAEESPS